MALKNTISAMQDLLSALHRDLLKADSCNKAAAQRVRTGSIKFEKMAKLYRKESVKAERDGKMKKTPAAKKTTKKAAANKSCGKKTCGKKPVAKKVKKVAKRKSR